MDIMNLPLKSSVSEDVLYFCWRTPVFQRVTLGILRFLRVSQNYKALKNEQPKNRWFLMLMNPFDIWEVPKFEIYQLSKEDQTTFKLCCQF